MMWRISCDNFFKKCVYVVIFTTQMLWFLQQLMFLEDFCFKLQWFPSFLCAELQNLSKGCQQKAVTRRLFSAFEKKNKGIWSLADPLPSLLICFKKIFITMASLSIAPPRDFPRFQSTYSIRCDIRHRWHWLRVPEQNSGSITNNE